MLVIRLSANCYGFNRTPLWKTISGDRGFIYFYIFLYSYILYMYFYVSYNNFHCNSSVSTYWWLATYHVRGHKLYHIANIIITTNFLLMEIQMSKSVWDTSWN